MKAFQRLLTITLVGLLTYTAIPAKTFAQSAGQPVLTTGVGTLPTSLTTDTAFVDAFTATASTGGTDMCVRIVSAWTQALAPSGITSAIVDARGFNRNNGSWTCGVSPFPPTGKAARGTLLLGNVDIPVGTTWVIPTQTEVRGMGSGGTSNSTSPYSTILHNASIPSTTVNGVNVSIVLQMGSLPGGPGPWFGIRIADLTVDCQVVAACVGILNAESEENSSVNHVQIWDAPAYAMWISSSNSADASHPAATNSGPYQNINIANKFCTDAACSGEVGIRLDGPGGTGKKLIREFSDITVSGHALDSTGAVILHNIACGVVIYGVSTAFTNSHIEYASTGIQVGYNSTSTCSGVYGGTSVDTRGVEITNVSSSPLIGVGGNSVILGDSAGVTSPSFTADVTITGLQNVTTNANTVQDYTTGNTLTAAKDPYVGLYAVGHCSAGACTGTNKPPLVSNTQ